MKEINEIIENITEDSNLCLIREALELKEALKSWAYKRIKESEEYLTGNDTTYSEVLKNEDTGGYGEEGENNNFEAGIISGLEELKKEFDL